jgi:hypothetical protein
MTDTKKDFIDNVNKKMKKNNNDKFFVNQNHQNKKNTHNKTTKMEIMIKLFFNLFIVYNLMSVWD